MYPHEVGLHVFLLHILFFSPHLCAGFLFLVVHSRPRPPRLLLPPSVLPHHHAHTSLTHNSLTHTQLTHTHNSNSLTHFEASTSNLCGRHGTWGYRPSFYVAGAALISLHSVWQLRRLVTSTFILCGPVAPRLFVWQAWHLEASTSILCGRRGTW